VQRRIARIWYGPRPQGERPVSSKDAPARATAAVFLALGAAAAAGGVVVLVDADNVYERDLRSRTYNQFGPETARVGGGVMVAAGGLTAVISTIVLAVSASRGGGDDEPVELRREVRTEPGRTDGKPIECTDDAGREAIAGIAVSAEVTRDFDQIDSVPLGTTDDDGELRADLADALSRAGIEDGATARIVTGAHWRATPIDLAPVRAELLRRAEERTRRQLEQAQREAARAEREAEALRSLPLECDAHDRDACDRLCDLYPDEMGRANRDCVKARQLAQCDEGHLDACRSLCTENAKSPACAKAKELGRKANAAAAAQKQQNSSAAKRAECQATCRSSCGGDKKCESQCVSKTCR
jgi:hypothetical protein